METLERIYGGKGEELIGAEEECSSTIRVMLWYNQGDAAAKVGAEVVYSGGALKLDDAGKTKQKGTKGKNK